MSGGAELSPIAQVMSGYTPSSGPDEPDQPPPGRASASPAGWGTRKRNPRFPWCAEVARHMLADAIGLRHGEPYPPEDELLARAAAIAGDGSVGGEKAGAALNMLEEIGGL